MRTNLVMSIRGLEKKYSEIDVFEGINLEINKGEFICIIGPNGCGKTTLLNSIANIIEYNGEISRKFNKLALVSQNPKEMLLPWLNVRKNLCFPMKEEEIGSLFVDSLLETTKLKEYEKKYPYELSGGMEQLLIISRALANKSDLILLDEPFKSLDFYMAKKMQSKLTNIWERYNPTIIMVSHDIEEAISMADKIVVLSGKPSKIKKIIKIDLHRPRGIDILNSDEFLRIKREVLNVFFE